MPDFCFVHAADLHLGSPFAGVRASSPQTASALASATVQALDNIVKLCIARKAAFLVLAGDVFDSEATGIGAQYHLFQALSSLASSGIPSFVAWGNHDPLSAWRAKFNWPSEVHFFSSEVESYPVQLNGRRIATVSGISYERAEVTENLMRRFEPRSSQEFSVGVLHCNVGGATEHANYSPCTVEDLAASPFDYWALGHVHEHRIIRPPGQPDRVAVYPGCAQGRNPRETGAKGCCVVSVSSGKLSDVEFVPVDTVRWMQLQVDVGGMEGLDEFIAYASRRCADFMKYASAPSAGLALRITAVGRGSVHSLVARRGVAEVEESVRSALEQEAQAMGGVWWWLECIEDRTRAEVDRDSLRSCASLVSDLIAAADELHDDDAALENMMNSIMPDMVNSQARAIISDMTSDDLRELVHEAEAMALDLLLGEGRSS